MMHKIIGVAEFFLEQEASADKAKSNLADDLIAAISNQRCD